MQCGRADPAAVTSQSVSNERSAARRASELLLLCVKCGGQQGNSFGSQANAKQRKASKARQAPTHRPATSCAAETPNALQRAESLRASPNTARSVSHRRLPLATLAFKRLFSQAV